ncbi:hypothetical protein B0H17DRAFT_436403 [Mycena rosella]|uniref:Thioesterase domain-containing protein n=1 Tax=Mycena rosella TaxID=1033263 RepID=A0AAD7CE06_MYCRO|nr:hypothetical protein B0H17DRAFT_436403 [Mycena rosella]
MPLDSTNAAMVRILRTPVPDAVLDAITGTAARTVKARAVQWLDIYHAPPCCFAGRAARRTAVTDVSLAPALPGAGAGEDALTLVCEIDITEDSLSAADTLANAVLVAVIDECVSAAVSAHDFARGGPGMSGVSLSLNTVFHHPVELGARLRLINTTLAVTPGTTSCRSEVWDLARRRLVATAVFAGMPSSTPRALAKL